MKIVVLVKQVIDSEIPESAFLIDSSKKSVSTPPNITPVINGYDEQAIEAALRIRDSGLEVEIIAVSLSDSFIMDVIKKPLAMGVDSLVLVEDPIFRQAIDPLPIIDTLKAVIEKIGDVDLILSGRQASDWDNAQVPIGLAEKLSWPVFSLAKRVEIENGNLKVERVLVDGFDLATSKLPAVVTVSNELGTPRYPTMRGIMQSKRNEPLYLSIQDLGISNFRNAFELISLDRPNRTRLTEIVEGETDEDAGRKLAIRMREENLI